MYLTLPYVHNISLYYQEHEVMIHPGCEQNFKFPFGILYVAISRDDTVIEIDIQYSTITPFMICVFFLSSGTRGDDSPWRPSTSSSRPVFYM